MRRPQHDTRSIGELIEAAFMEAEWEDDAFYDRYPSVAVLHVRGTRDVLEAALTLCRSLDAKCRALGADILGQLGSPDRTFPEECCDALLALLRRDPERDVLVSTIFALGHLGNRRADPDLAGLRRHPDALIRHGVAFALNGSTSPVAVEALLALMEDADAETRDWATTGIGMEGTIDGPEVRAALWRRTADEDELVRGEALHGLARRGDRRVVPRLLAELIADNEHSYCFEEVAKTVLGLEIDQEVSTEALIEGLQAARH